MVRFSLALPLLLLVGCDRADPSTSAPAPSSSVILPRQVPDAGPGIRELLGGLKPGDSLGNAQVQKISSIAEGVIYIDLNKGDATGTITLARFAEQGPLPPVKTKKYALFFLTPTPQRPSLAQNELLSACEALAERLRATEDTVAVPAGLSPYTSARLLLAPRSPLPQQRQRRDLRPRGHGAEQVEHLGVAEREALQLVEGHPAGLQRVLVGLGLGRLLAGRAPHEMSPPDAPPRGHKTRKGSGLVLCASGCPGHPRPDKGLSAKDPGAPATAPR